MESNIIKILIIEDSDVIATGIKTILDNEGFKAYTSNSIKETKEILNSNKFDLILLDILLPDGNGIDFYCTIKKVYGNIPIIFLTAKSSEDDVVKGLELGADDYIIKPFRMRELISRIKNILRRNDTSNIKIGPIYFDKENNTVYKRNEPIELTALEYKLLCILMENLGKVITREYLLGRIWDVSSNFVNDNTLTVYMKRIRDKIEDDPNNPKIIKTIRGIGYKVESNEIQE